MRKALIFFAFLLCTGIIGMLCIGSAMTHAEYDVSFIEASSYGDAASADGLKVSVNANFKNRLSWNSVYSFGKAAPGETDFTFFSKPLYEPGSYEPGSYEPLALHIFNNSSLRIYGGSLLYDEEDTIYPSYEFRSMEKIMHDVESRTENGESRTESIRYKDYYEYFPMDVNLYPRDYHFNGYGSEEAEHFLSPADYGEINDVFESYFRIPVPEDYIITVQVEKDSLGNLVQLSTEGENSVQISAVSIDTDDGVYFALQTQQGFDSGNIPGGNGIYLLPAAAIADENGEQLTTIDIHGLKTVYSIGDSALIQKLYMSEDKSCLNLITAENGSLVLRAIDIASMSEKQVLPLLDDISGGGWRKLSYADGHLLALMDDNRFVLADSDRDNHYSIVLTGTRNGELLEPFRGYMGEPVISWDGERMALVTEAMRFVPETDDFITGYSYITCGFTVEVFDESGLTYKGIYESSLDVLEAEDSSYSKCALDNIGGLSVSW